MKRYRVESKSDKSHFRSDCGEKDLEFWKAICKSDANANKGKCYYREFPVTKNKKVYYAKGNEKLTSEEVAIIAARLDNVEMEQLNKI